MKLDEKYFVPFLGVVAVGAALIIVFFTISNKQGREETFKKNIVAQDSLRYQPMPVFDAADSLSVSSFSNQFVILDFWASWTESFSREAHRQLAQLKKQYPDRVEIIAAVVEDTPKNTREFIDRHDYPFNYVNGTAVFNRFHVPGVPTQLVYKPGAELSSIFTGYADSTRMDSLQTLLSDGS